MSLTLSAGKKTNSRCCTRARRSSATPAASFASVLTPHPPPELSPWLLRSLPHWNSKQPPFHPVPPPPPRRRRCCCPHHHYCCWSIWISRLSQELWPRWNRCLWKEKSSQLLLLLRHRRWVAEPLLNPCWLMMKCCCSGRCCCQLGK